MGTQPTVPSAEGVISKPSPYSVDETIRRLEEVVGVLAPIVVASVEGAMCGLFRSGRQSGLQFRGPEPWRPQRG